MDGRESERLIVLKGRSFLIRYSDDFVMVFSCESDARRVMNVLPKCFEKYGLTVHPEKRRLVPFEQPSDRPKWEGTPKGTPPGTFDSLGFTHFWSRSRKGYWVVKRKTSRSRFRRSFRRWRIGVATTDTDRSISSTRY
jgi:RNA-directed DNA polymerase